LSGGNSLAAYGGLSADSECEQATADAMSNAALLTPDEGKIRARRSRTEVLERVGHPIGSRKRTAKDANEELWTQYTCMVFFGCTQIFDTVQSA
jgi:hypothetical protein